MLKTVTWYDNGWGYASRVVELVSRLAELESRTMAAAAR
jgi:glyceraldehyde-3-phosphate dehydrogenase/erythrose-4-phosphate dehydrogenase